MSEFIPALDEDQLEQLGLFLEKEYQARDALDFFGTHGLLTALTLGPKTVKVEEMINNIFEEPAEYQDEGEKMIIFQLIKNLQHEIQAILDTGDPFYVPCDLTLDSDDDEEPSALELWTAGFVEGSFLMEEQWYNDDEQTVAELMLPIMYGSGLFMDEPEMQAIEEDPKLEKSVLDSIPDIVSELYLFFHGDEKK